MNTYPTHILMLFGICFDIQYAPQAAKQRLHRTCGSATGAPARTQPPKNKIIFMKNHPMHREDPLHTVCSMDPEMLLSSHQPQGPKTYSMYLKVDIDLKVSLVFSTLGSLQQPSSYSMLIAQCSVFIEILWTELGHFTHILANISVIQYEYIIDHAEFEFNDTQSQILHCSIFIQYEWIWSDGASPRCSVNFDELVPTPPTARRLQQISSYNMKNIATCHLSFSLLYIRYKEIVENKNSHGCSVEFGKHRPTSPNIDRTQIHLRSIFILYVAAGPAELCGDRGVRSNSIDIKDHLYCMQIITRGHRVFHCAAYILYVRRSST